MEKNAKIYVAGHHGLVGSAIWKICNQKDTPTWWAAVIRNWTCSTA